MRQSMIHATAAFLSAVALWASVLGTGGFLASSARAETSVNARIAGGKEIWDIVGSRYKCRLIENESPYIIILFGYHRVYGPGGTYMLETNLYADGLRYHDGTVTTWPMIGAYVPAQASLRAAIQDYYNPVHCGAKTLSPEMFPRQTYLVDGIPNLYKTDMVSQTNLNGREFQVEVSRGDLVTDYTGWQGARTLDPNTLFREWRILITIDGTTYVNVYAVPDDWGAYLCWYECLNFESEFYWRSYHFRALLWDLEIQREREPFWRRVNDWDVRRQDDPPVDYGVRVIQDRDANGVRNVIEVSNDANGGIFLPLDTAIDLALLPASENPPDLTISSAAVTETDEDQGATVVTTVTNLGGGIREPFEVGYFLSTDQQIDLNDVFTGSQQMSSWGLDAGESATFTTHIQVPQGVPSGQYHIAALADYRGAIAELDNNNNARIAGSITAAGSLPAADEWQMPRDFALEGWMREEFPDTRIVTRGTPKPPTPLVYAGQLKLPNGDLVNAGPAYTGSEFYPYVMLDVERQWLLLHPSSTSAAAVGFIAPRDGSYEIAGAYARANTTWNAGDGVTVAVLRNGDMAHRLFVRDVPSSAAVDSSDLFAGPGVAAFDLAVNLLKGDTIRFLVLNGPGGTDIGFDVTALQFRVVPPKAE